MVHMVGALTAGIFAATKSPTQQNTDKRRQQRSSLDRKLIALARDLPGSNDFEREGQDKAPFL
jgi:hypothetical protein